jgi:glycolate oxidase iron-sulfur subunit
MQEYHLILRGTEYEARAEAFRRRVMDVSAFLVRLGLRPLPGKQDPIRVAYHDACHLAHAQNITAEPRQLLQAIPRLELVDLPDAQFCCGSAGTYNLDQPEIASSLGQKKAKTVLATGAQILVSGNIGCLSQLRLHMTKLGSPIPARHIMQVLRDAYARSDELSSSSSSL